MEFIIDSLCVETSFFFFQAEDGIRDLTVTGVQTCALPILPRFAYLNDTTSPCSVRRRRPWMEPAGWAAMARPVGAPPRLTEPPRPWKKAIGTPHSRPRRGGGRLGFGGLPVGGKETAALVRA